MLTHPREKPVLQIKCSNFSTLSFISYSKESLPSNDANALLISDSSPNKRTKKENLNVRGLQRTLLFTSVNLFKSEESEAQRDTCSHSQVEWPQVGEDDVHISVRTGTVSMTLRTILEPAAWDKKWGSPTPRPARGGGTQNLTIF